VGFDKYTSKSYRVSVMGRKIAVVGMSPAGLVQLASLVKGRGAYEEFSDDEYVLIHDPDKV